MTFVYRTRYGEFPPDFSTGDPKAEIEQHLKNVFPDRLTALDLPEDMSGFGPHNALYFWLRGFSSDPERPLTGDGWQWMYNFDWARLKNGIYYPRSGNAPYIYFRADTYATAKCTIPGCGTAYPYFSKESTRNLPAFEEERRFQIISAGVDGSFGSDRVVAGSTIFGAHSDNLTNFNDGPLGDASIEQQRTHLTETRNFSSLVALACLAAYPCISLLRKRTNGIQALRKLVARQAAEKPQTRRWTSIRRAHRRKHKSDAIRRMSNTGD